MEWGRPTHYTNAPSPRLGDGISVTSFSYHPISFENKLKVESLNIILP